MRFGLQIPPPEKGTETMDIDIMQRELNDLRVFKNWATPLLQRLETSGLLPIDGDPKPAPAPAPVPVPAPAPVPVPVSIDPPAADVTLAMDPEISAAAAPSASFTLAGLADGVGGTVTFSDGTNADVVVPVSGNGTYQADLSTLSDAVAATFVSADGSVSATAATNVTASSVSESASDPGEPASSPSTTEQSAQ
jgi:hypothetical protein